MEYQVIDILRIPMGWEMVFFPVLRRPGRQRCTRLAFDAFAPAIVYGVLVAARYARMFQEVNGEK